MSGGYPVRRALLRLMGVAVLSLAGHTAVPAAQVIRMGLSTSAVTLDPRFATDAVSQRICRLLYRPLVDFDQTYHPVPALADWQKLTPTHYRFTLRSDRRRFSDGTRLTATDVKATYDDILSPAKAINSCKLPVFIKTARLYVLKIKMQMYPISSDFMSRRRTKNDSKSCEAQDEAGGFSTLLRVCIT